MKKIKFLSLLLVAFLLLTVVGCGKSTGNQELEDAKTALHAQHKDDAAVTPADYELLTVLKIGDKTYKIEWKVAVTEGDANDVKVVEKDDKTVVIDVNERAKADVKYTLTPVISDEKGNKIEGKSYEKSFSAFKVFTWAEYAAAEKSSTVTIEGVVTAFAASGSKASIYLADKDGGYYVYNITVTEEDLAKIQVGKTLIVTGTKDEYNTTYEIINASYEISDDTVKTVEPVDITEVFGACANGKDQKLTKMQGMYVTIKGVTLDHVDGKYAYFTLNENSIYVYLSTSSYWVNTAGMSELEGKVVKGQKADITGVIGMYSNEIQIIPLDTNAITHVKENLTDAQKVERAEALVKELEGKVCISNLDLFTTTLHEGVSVAWTSANPDLIANDGKLGNFPLEETAVELTAVITCGSETKTVKVNVKVAALSVSKIANVLPLCDGGEKPTVMVVGKVVALDKNGNPFIADSTGVIYVYTKLGDAAQVGDTVQVVGTATTYTGKQYTRQIGNATFTKLDKSASVLRAVNVSIDDLAAAANEDEVKANALYGKLVAVTGYVTLRGSYNNVYLAKENDKESAAVGYWYNGAEQDGMKALEGKLVTVVAPIYNFSFSDNAWLLGSAVEVHEGEYTVPAPTGADIVNEAYALEQGEALEGKPTLTGEIVSIDTAYSEQYKNITVTIKVEGAEDKPIVCFRMKGDGAESLAVGDVITVTGVLKNYKGTIEFDANCTFTK